MMENNKNGKNNGNDTQQDKYKQLLGGKRVMEGFGQKLPKNCEKLEYVSKIGSAMRAWVECGNTKQRGYILLATGEFDGGEENARSLVVSLGGPDVNLIAMMMNALDSSPDLRRVFGRAVMELAALPDEGE